MKLIEVKCPSCGGILKIDENQHLCTCPYCERQVLYDDGVVRIVITDTAKMRELDLYEQERKRQEEEIRAAREKAELEARLFKKKRKLWWLCVVVWAIILLGIMIVTETTDTHLQRWAIMFFLGWFILPSVYPQSAEEKQHRFKTWLKMFGIVLLSVFAIEILIGLIFRLIVPGGISSIR